MHVLTRVYACVSVYVGEWIQGTASQLAEWQSSIKQTISKDTLGRLAAWAPWKQAPPNTSLLLVQKGRAHCGSALRFRATSGAGDSGGGDLAGAAGGGAVASMWVGMRGLQRGGRSGLCFGSRSVLDLDQRPGGRPRRHTGRRSRRQRRERWPPAGWGH